MRTYLLDTGPLVAYLDRTDRAHVEVVKGLERCEGQLCTTSAVVTEAMYFVTEVREGPTLLLEFLESTGTVVFDYCQPGPLRQAVSLMDKYADLPMDFADATLVLLAESTGATEILTLDRRGFKVFRTPGGKAFRLVLDEPPMAP